MPVQPTAPTIDLSPTAPRGASQPLVIVFAAVSAGILSDRLWTLPIAAWWTAAAVSLSAWGLLRNRRRSAMPRLSVDVLLLAAAALAAAWHHCRWNGMADDDLSRFARRKAEPVCVEAVAVASPRPLPKPSADSLRMVEPGEGSRLPIELLALRDGAQWQPIAGRATLTISGPMPCIQAGDRLRCFAKLSMPFTEVNPGGFDYAAYLRSEGIRCRLHADGSKAVSIIQPGRWHHPRRLLDQARVYSSRVFEQFLDPRCAEMAAAVLLGERERVDAGRTETFMATGTVHLLSISGMHFGILAGALFWVVRRTPLPRSWAALLTALAAIVYMLLVDTGPPVIRATVLVLILCASEQLGRRPLGFNSLAAAALVVLILNPNHLFHIGAQLSFLSVAGIIWFMPYWLDSDKPDALQRLIAQNRSGPERLVRSAGRFIWQVILLSAVLWLLTMPLVTARFHLCTPVAVFVNAAIWAPMAFALVSGGCLMLVGGISSTLGYLCGAFCNFNLWLLEWFVVAARQIPCSHFWVAGPADWWLIGFYGGLALLAAFPHIRPSRRWCFALLAGWVAIGFIAAKWQRPRGQLDCTFVAMGHGCAAVLELPNGKTMLYDAGQMGEPSAGVRTISGFLWSRGITRLDAVFLSHADTDHYNALPGLIERFSVGSVYVSPAMFHGTGNAINVLREAIEQHKIPMHTLRAGDRLNEGDGCTLEVLHPSDQDTSSGTNVNSLVLMVGYQDRQILLPGDVEANGLQEVLAGEPRHCEVLMAPHHGSRQSNLPDLADWCTPAWVVFSDDGRWNTPDIDVAYQAAGSKTLHTNDCGAIHVCITDSGTRVEPFIAREPPPSSL